MNLRLQQANNEQWANIARQTKYDFEARGTTASPWVATAVSAGTAAAGASLTKHPGTATYTSHASNANSGYAYLMDIYGFILGGSEKTTIIFKTAAVLNGITRRMGFLNTSSVTAPADGVYGKIVDGVLTGQTIKATVGSTTASNYTLSINTWYRLVIELNADATLATFTLYADDSTTVLWTDTLAANIPTGLTGHGDVCTMALPSGGTAIGTIDYIDIVIPNARRVV